MDITINQSECKLIPCLTCQMYLLATNDEYAKLKEQCPEPSLDSDCIVITCQNCVDKEQLHQQIELLNSEINYLNGRVSSLRSIRDDKNIIDQSINEFTNMFDALYVGPDNSGTVLMKSYSQNIGFVEPSVDASIDTSIWTDNNNVFDDVLVGLQQRSNISVLPESVSEEILAESKNTENDSVKNESSTSAHSLSFDFSSEMNNKSSEDTILEITFPHQNDNCLKLVSSNDTIDNSVNELTSAIPIFTDIIYDSHVLPTCRPHPTLNNDDIIETLIIGDCSVKHIKMHAGSASPNKAKTYKVLKPHSCIPEMMATAEHLLTKRFKNVKLVILHAGLNDAKIKGSEEIKASIKSFCNLITNKLGKQLVISGPILNMNMNSEVFSRILAVNSWLISAIDDKEICASYAENFDLFWSKEHLLFKEDRKTLNYFGAAVLSNNIICNLDCTM